MPNICTNVAIVTAPSSFLDALTEDILVKAMAGEQVCFLSYIAPVDESLSKEAEQMRVWRD